MTAPGIVVSCVAAALALAAAAFAQERPTLANSTPEQRAKMQTEFMTSKLDLATDQVAKVQGINLKYAEKMEPVLKGTEDQVQKVRASSEMSRNKDVELKQVLSDEQYKHYLASKEEMRAHAEQRLEDRASGQ